MNEMSKTHWAALLVLAAKGLEAGGIIPIGLTDAANYVVTTLLGLAVGHRVAKATGIVKSQP